jgi:hypothetical protein
MSGRCDCNITAHETVRDSHSPFTGKVDPQRQIQNRKAFQIGS